MFHLFYRTPPGDCFGSFSLLESSETHGESDTKLVNCCSSLQEYDQKFEKDKDLFQRIV